jgi:hypothetical protein
LKKTIITALLFITPQLSMAAGLANDMQVCQGLIDFIDGKLVSPPEKYAASDVKKIRQGLAAYNEYIQSEIVTPELLAFTGGNMAKANAMQKQVNKYKATLASQFEARYPQNRLFTDQAVAVNHCAKKSAPSGHALEALKTALNTMVTLAKLN